MQRIVNLQKELFNVTLALSFYWFAGSLIGVFIPLIILQHGAPLWWVAGFYLAYALTKLILNYPIMRLIQLRGAHIGLGCGFVATVVHLLAIFGYSQTGSVEFVVLGAAGLGISNAFIWDSMHIHLTEILESGKQSSNIAALGIINRVLGLLAPFIGGLIGTLAGPRWLTGIAFGIMVLGFFPLRGIGALERNRLATKAEPLHYSMKGAPWHDTLANSASTSRPQ